MSSRREGPDEDLRQVEALWSVAARLRAEGPTTSRGRVVVHLLGLAAGVALAAGPLGLVGDLAAVAAMAVLFLHADAMQHEAVHRHVARTAVGNRLVGLLASVPVLVPYSLYSAFHHAHHAHVARADDPEGRHQPAARWPWAVEGLRTARFWVGQLAVGLRALTGVHPPYVRTDRQRTAVCVDTAITIVAGAALLAGSLVAPTIRWVWLAPFLIYLLVLFPVFHTYEHAGAEGRAEADPGIDPIRLTGTVRLPRTVSAVLWHATLHTAHHAFPSVPWRRLPELQVHLDEHLPPELVHEGVRAYLRRPVPDHRAVDGAAGTVER